MAKAKRIRQGQTRWRLGIIRSHDGLVNEVYVRACIVVHATPFAVYYRNDSSMTFVTSHWGWLQMKATRRKAWREALALVRETDRLRNEEYKQAWQENH